ncbi:Trehalose synthase [Vulgatibacter incomptus]|uniref:maltose alpha-D-glucosyltransferase n=2 Tax=Vulgatibacter incomptus TaxID=1391653 RepID=A0A0K1PIS2_9BACT|nr:Trehalose synthase [Vulgatibacter incomptus]
MRKAAPSAIPKDPHWYKEALLYELRVRSFCDSNDDGVGDLKGLTSKLGYIQDLGVTAIWLLPFYPSPGRDDGYDIADYFDVDPEVGSLDDFEEFLDEAHSRGLRVITEIVLNHTSDAHPWFQRARRAPPGSEHRDFYVWSETADRYREARIIFKDFEHSNWSWDPVAKAYFWHRFYSHQPDLNFDNPAVHEAVMGAVDFWLDLGVDGLRLDAVPYLYEREGTNCENLPETHAFIRKLRAHVDSKYEDRMLLAEANQWPEDAAAYFGAGDQCHMNFHFPMMPRIFMSIHQEDRFPIIDIHAQTPAIPETSQWAVFLRNHDELTLEMVTDEERDYMYGAYASDPAARINLGIRRRLAPLVGNNRRVIELMNSLLFSLPGTPVIYYGDEIGMGDNIYLGDRNGVRTPMQWSADRNAGFSRCNPQRLILPVIVDPEYHFESVNVEAQQDNPNSLLWWTKRLIALRKRFRSFGWGSIEFLSPDNPRVLAFVRKVGSEILLVVANLSRFVQYVELDLSKYQGMFPLELFGRTEFPPIGELPYLLTVSGHGFYWFQLKWPIEAALDARAHAYQPPILEVARGWESVLEGDARLRLEDVLTEWLRGRRWFEGGRRAIHSLSILEAVTLPGEAMAIVLVEARYAETEPEWYLLALAHEGEERAGELQARAPQSIIAHLHSEGPSYGVLYDALSHPASCSAMVRAIVARVRARGRTADLVGTMAMPFEEELAALEPRIVPGDPSNTAVSFGDRLLLKVYRRQGEGMNPELELGRHLASGPTPLLVGALELEPRRAERRTVATLFEYVAHEGDAMSQAREELGRFFERVLTETRGLPPIPAPSPSLARLARLEPPAGVAERIGTYLEVARKLGRRAGELHLALMGKPEDPVFALEPYSAMDQRSTYQTMRNVTGKALRRLRISLPRISTEFQPAAQEILQRSLQLYERFRPLLDRKLEALRMRHHGRLELARFLFTGKDYVIVDFEGDKARPLPERRRKRSPLRDVATMVRSFQRVASTVLFDPALVRPEDHGTAAPWAVAWWTWVSAAFVGSYLETVGDAAFVPKDRDELGLLLDAFLLETTLAELEATTADNPLRGDVPIFGLLALLDAGPDSALA